MKHRPAVAACLCLALLLSAAVACAVEIRPLENGPEGIDPGNGRFRLLIPDRDRIGEENGFTASLFTVDRYDAEQIRALSPGDTVWVGGRAMTVEEVIVHPPAAEYVGGTLRGTLQYYVFLEAGYPENQDVIEVRFSPEEDVGYLAFLPLPDGSFYCVRDGWSPVSLTGTVWVGFPLPEGFTYTRVVNDMDFDADPPQDEILGAEGFLEDLADEEITFDAYCVSCLFENGTLTEVSRAVFPGSPAPEEEEE